MARKYERHGLSGTRLYNIWDGMHGRCYRPNTILYRKYGGRGISICQSWYKNFPNFYKWSMENGYKEDLSIDRINNDGNYEESNCRWVNKSINGINRGKAANTTSKYMGISFSEKRKGYKKWKASFNFEKKTYNLGFFLTEKEALEAKNKFIIDNKIGEHKIQLFKN